MIRKILILVIFLLLVAWVPAMAKEGNQGQCRVDFVAVIYGTPNGGKPIKFKGADQALKQATKAIANEVLKQAVKKASGILSLAGNLNTAKMVHHVNIIYAYRFVHKGKPTSEWELKSRNKLSNGSVDYFFFIKDSKNRAHQELKKLQEGLDKELKEQCKEHEQS